MKTIKIIILIISAIICASCAAAPALAYTIEGKVIYVYDGDTVLLKEIVSNPSVTYGDSSPIRGATHRIRLASIDAPEKSQPYGLEATQILGRLIQNKTVHANVIDTDKYGRKIAYVHINDHLHCSPGSPGNNDISSIMLANGAAWHYKAFDKTISNYDLHYALEHQAKANKRGLWAQDYPIAPWTWRRNIANRKPSENMPPTLNKYIY